MKLISRMSLKRQRGATLVVAIFIMVVFAVFAAAMWKMNSSGQQSIYLQTYHTRALMAAQSGIDWILTRIFPLGGGAAVTCSSIDTASPIGVIDRADGVPDFSVITGMNSCSVTLECTQRTILSKNYYKFTSTATCVSIGAWEVSRKLIVEAQTL